MKVRFGELVRQHRERSGMNKQTFAERVGIDPSYLRLIEKGEATSPSALIVACMVEVLHLNPFEAVTLLKTLREDAKNEDEAPRLEAI